MAETVRIDGLEEVRRALMETPVELRRKVMYRLLRKAAQPIVRAARAGAPVASKATRRVVPGLLKKTIGVARSRIKQPARGEFGVYITALKPAGIKRIGRKARRSGAAGPNFGDPFYHRFQEGGFHAVGTRRIGGGRANRAAKVKASGARFIPGKAYLGQAYAAHRAAAVNTLRADLVTETVAAFQKKAKR